MSANGDDGRAVERTALAWQRTALALATGSAVATRLAVDRLGLLALVGLLALPLSWWAFVESRRCQRRSTSSRETSPERDGRGPTLITMGIVLTASTEIAVQLSGPHS
jgi:uncharacterized membrane protein YidH (DUF202 family)